MSTTNSIINSPSSISVTEKWRQKDKDRMNKDYENEDFFSCGDLYTFGLAKAGQLGEHL